MSVHARLMNAAEPAEAGAAAGRTSSQPTHCDSPMRRGFSQVPGGPVVRVWACRVCHVHQARVNKRGKPNPVHAQKRRHEAAMRDHARGLLVIRALTQPRTSTELVKLTGIGAYLIWGICSRLLRARIITDYAAPRPSRGRRRILYQLALHPAEAEARLLQMTAAVGNAPPSEFAGNQHPQRRAPTAASPSTTSERTLGARPSAGGPRDAPPEAIA